MTDLDRPEQSQGVPARRGSSLIPRDQRERAVFFGLVGAACGLVPTAYVTFTSNSLVLLGDFLRCLVEFLSIAVSWLIIRRAVRGDRQFYDYGFGKLERLGSVSVALAMLCTFLVLAFVAITRLLHPLALEGTIPGLLLSVLAVGANGTLWIYNQRVNARESSLVIEAQAALFRAKTMASLVVVLTLGLSAVLPPGDFTDALDPIGSLFLGGFLFYSAVVLLSSSMDDLLDRSVQEAARLAILQVLISHEAQFSGFRGIRTRKAGTKIFVDLLLEFPEALPFGDVCRASRLIADDVRARLGGSEVSVIPHTGVRPGAV